MKYILRILYLFLAVMAVGLTSCSEDKYGTEELSDEETYVNVTLASYGRSSSDALVLGEAEYVIKRVRLYAFDGNKLDNVTYVDGLSVVGDTYTMRIKVRKTSAKTIYAVINEPDVADVHAQLALINNPAALNEMQYKLSQYMSGKIYNWDYSFSSGDFCLPMYGVTASTVNCTNATASANLTVNRSVARVDVMLQKSNDVTAEVTANDQTEFSVYKLYDNGYLSGRLAVADNAAYESVVGGSSTLFVRNTNSPAIRAFSFYVPAYKCSSASDRPKFIMSKLNYGTSTFDFNVTVGEQLGLTSFDPNKVYRVTCTIKPQNPDIYLEILDWKDVEVDGEIYGADIVAPGNIVMDWWNLGEKFDTTFDFSSTIKDVELDGYYVNNVKLAAPPTWLTVTPPALPAKSGTFKLTYNITGGTNAAENDGNHPDVQIRLRSGNIVKCVNVVYDNGYLPNSILQAYGWTENLPARGIHLSKSGNIYPTKAATTYEDEFSYYMLNLSYIYWIIGTGGNYAFRATGDYGKGMENTTMIIGSYGANAVMPNKSKELGDDWYLPSAKELKLIAFNQQYLGISYHYYAIGSEHQYDSSSDGGIAVDGSDVNSSNIWGIFFQNGYMLPSSLQKSRFKYYYAYHCCRSIRTMGTNYNVTLTTTARNVTLSGAGTYESGRVVNISATAANFSSWTVVSGGTVIFSSTSASTWFVMPNANVSIRANYISYAN